VPGLAPCSFLQNLSPVHEPASKVRDLRIEWRELAYACLALAALASLNRSTFVSATAA
jgi:hypothetical protein